LRAAIESSELRTSSKPTYGPRCERGPEHNLRLARDAAETVCSVPRAGLHGLRLSFLVLEIFRAEIQDVRHGEKTFRVFRSERGSVL
jgi:hypothetical protein